MLRSAVQTLVTSMLVAVTLLVSSRAVAGPSVTITSPGAGASYQDSVPIAATVQSQYVIANVHAQVQAPGIDLTAAGNGYSGTLDITALPAGAFTVTVTATDALNGTGSSTVSVVHILAPPPPPPSPGLVVTTFDGLAIDESAQLRLLASCSGTAAYPCTSLDASIGGVSVGHTNGSALDANVAVATYLPNGGTVTFDASNAGGTHTTKTIAIVAISDPHYILVESTDGTLLDFDAGRLLFANPNSGATILRDRVSRADTTLASSVASTGHLSPIGAFFSGYEWRNGVLGTDPMPAAGGTNIRASLSPGGGYQAWTDVNAGAWFRDVVSNTTTQVFTGAALDTAVAADGTAEYVFYDQQTGEEKIWVSSNGAAPSKVTSQAGRFVGPVAASATLVGYHQHYSQPLYWSIHIGNCGDFEQLAKEPTPLVDYAGAGAWCAVTKFVDNGAGTKVRVVYTRSTTGALLLASVFNTDTTILALGEDGTVAYTTGGSSYLGRAGGGAPFPLLYGTPVYAIGAWYLKLGTGLYRLNPDSDAGAPPVDAGTDATLFDAGADSSDDASGARDGEADARMEGGVDAQADGSSPEDAGSSEDAGAIADATVHDGAASDGGPHDSGSGAPTSDTGTESDSTGDQADGGGCSMSAASPRSDSMGQLLVIAALALARARKRLRSTLRPFHIRRRDPSKRRSNSS